MKAATLARRQIREGYDLDFKKGWEALADDLQLLAESIRRQEIEPCFFHLSLDTWDNPNEITMLGVGSSPEKNRIPQQVLVSSDPQQRGL